jgi:hypothetical protein
MPRDKEADGPAIVLELGASIRRLPEQIASSLSSFHLQ